MIRLDEIPAAFERPADTRPSNVVARIRAIRPSRRAVLRGLVIGATAAALVPVDWYLTRRSAAADEGSTSEYTTCPKGYEEESNNWPASGPAVCVSGWKRGTFPCVDGYHREGSYTSDGTTFESTRLSSNCHGRNAWRWNGYRCSDAMTNATFDDGSAYSGITIAACQTSSDTADDEGSADPSAPKEVVPDLGVGLRALPGIGALAGR